MHALRRSMDTFLPVAGDPVGRFRHRACPAVSLRMIMTAFSREGKLKKFGRVSKKLTRDARQDFAHTRRKTVHLHNECCNAARSRRARRSSSRRSVRRPGVIKLIRESGLARGLATAGRRSWPKTQRRRSASRRSSCPICIWARRAARPICCSTSSRITTGRDLPRRRHRRRLAAPNRAGTGRRATTTSCRSSCARPARARASIYIPGNHDEFLRDLPGTHFGGIEFVDAGASTRPRTAGATSSSTATSSTSWCATPAGSPISATGLHDSRCAQHRAQQGAPPPGLRLLVALGLGQAQGEERRQLHRPASRRRCRARPRRRGVDGVICGHIHHAAMREHRGIPTSTPATGWKAAPPSSSITTAPWRSALSGCCVPARGPRRGDPVRPAPAGRRAVACTHPRSSPWFGDRMRLLVATDAWHPQVNGVVRSLEHDGGGGRVLGVRSGVPDARGVSARCRCPAIRRSGSPRGVSARSRDAAAGQPRPTSTSPRRGRSAFCDVGALPGARAALHDELSHALSRIPRGPRARPGGLVSYAGCDGSTMPSSGTMVSTPVPRARPRRRAASAT